jgi:cytochrome c biogenesis protein CcmG/thiol:disulfide interchange protein DsbE
MTLTRSKIIGFSIAFILFVFLISLLAYGLATRSSVTGQSGVNLIGKAAPDFEFTTFNGSQFKLSDHIGKPIVVNFWASWCSPCREEAEILEESYVKLNPSVVFIGVNIQDTESDATEFINEFDLNYLNGPDKTGSITIDYGVIGLPVTFFVDNKGVIVDRWVGTLTDKTLTEMIYASLGSP